MASSTSGPTATPPLPALLTERGAHVITDGNGRLTVAGLEPGAIAAVAGLLFLAVTVFNGISPDGSTTLTHWAPGVAAEGLTWATFHDPEWPSAGLALLLCLTYLVVTTTRSGRRPARATSGIRATPEVAHRPRTDRPPGSRPRARPAVGFGPSTPEGPERP
ncbi:hypothetical protein OG738_37785 [Amycolatopsis sp. NBC_01488]|uniref:hypothetical protein n=1 Tax=Amycolatopsis sp. NBC_01488 TaxID=2903563 RepID=UPI002E2A7984|nr:hypothetical protein [Amycolatopsis sp. NBC_01488]